MLARSERLPPMLRGLVRQRARSAATNGSPASLVARLGATHAAERPALVADLVTSAVTAVMGEHAGGLNRERPLQELGLDSLMTVELRNRLGTLTGLRLPPTLLFDYPTIAS